MTTKPRILITMHYLEIGGAESSLIGLLHAIDYDKIDVDLFLHARRGEMMAYIPERVNVLPEIPAYALIEAPLKQAIKRGHFLLATSRIWARLRMKFAGKWPKNGTKPDSSIFQYIASAVSPWLPRINPSVTYDMCLSFLAPHNFALNKVNARRTIGWIHTDYSTINIDKSAEMKSWQRLDKIISISDEVTRTFSQVFPSLSNRIITIENILPEKFVKSRADTTDVSGIMTGPIKLLSVGRFTYPKNFDNIPDITRRLVYCHNLDVKWYIIGYGGEEGLIRERIKQCGMADHVIILGKKSNPYPYIKACDIYVQPSRYEGKSVTVREAQMLRRPVVITNYPTSASQIIHGKDGIITGMDNESIADAIDSLVNDPHRIAALKDYLSTHDYSNSDEVNKIYTLLPQ